MNEDMPDSPERRKEEKKYKLQCPRCNYIWTPRLVGKTPVGCPRCGKRLDYKMKPIFLEIN